MEQSWNKTESASMKSPSVDDKVQGQKIIYIKNHRLFL